MTSKRWIRSAVGLATIAVATIAVVPPSVPGAPSVSAAEGPGAGGELHTVKQKRILDTRGLDPADGTNDPVPGPKVTGSAINIPVLGLAGVPADPEEVLAVGVSVTIVSPQVDGYAEVYPKGFRSSPPTSLINYAAGVDVPNMVILGVGNDGSITVLPQASGGPAGEVDVLVDVFGWVSKTGYVDAADTGSRLITLDSPIRFFDQRPLAPPANTLGPNDWVSMQVRGRNGIPNSPAVSGVVINLTVDNSRLATNRSTFVSALSDESSGPPSTSTTNVPGGKVKANLAFVPVGDDGYIHFYNSKGDTQLIVDVFGYLETGREDPYLGRVIPLEFPFRGFDTRQILFGNVPLGIGEQEDWSFWCFGDSITVNGQPVNRQSALLGNVTGDGFNRVRPDLPNDTFLTLRPRDPAAAIPPHTSNINAYPGAPVPNMALLTYGDSDPLPDYGNAIDPYMIRAYNHNGTLHYILDVFAIVLSDDPAPPIPAATGPGTEPYCGAPV